jgi:hypothetical protein
VVDSGDYFFPDISLVGVSAHQLKKKAAILADAAKAMGYDVVCPGEADLATGVGGLKELYKTAGVTPVCANLMMGNTRVFNDIAIREIGGVKVGFTGILQTNRPLPQEGNTPLVLTESEAALKSAVDHLKAEGAEVIVALTHIGFDQDREIVKKVPGIDVVIGGHTRESLGMGSASEKTMIYQVGYQGKYYGQIHFSAGDPGPDGKHKLVKQSGESHEMGPTRQEDPEWAKVVADYKKWVDEENQKNRPSPQETIQASDQNDIYWGAELCGQCHQKQNAWWKETIHAGAYQTLVRVNKQHDVECLACHTTAFTQTRTRPGLKSVSDVTGFENVQCESCHAPGSHHNAPEIRTRANTRETCIKCHDPKNSPKFDFPTWLPRMACPKGS